MIITKGESSRASSPRRAGKVGPQQGALLRLLGALLVVSCTHTPAPSTAAPAAPAAAAATTATGPLSVKILAFNDFHGQISAGRKVKERPVGSAGVLAAYLKKASAGAEDRTLIAFAGDLVGASPPSSGLLHDEPTVSFVNLLSNAHCRHLTPSRTGTHGIAPETAPTEGAVRSFEEWLDPRCNVVGTVGNHEFDEGIGELRRLLEGGDHPVGPSFEKPWRGARYPTLAANVVDAKTNQPVFPPYVVKRISGVPIGFIGVVFKNAQYVVRQSGIAGLAFLDEADTVKRYVAELKQAKVRAIVLLLHQGAIQQGFIGPTKATTFKPTGAMTRLLAQLDDEVDVVVSGHVHSFTNALLQNANGKEILVTQAYLAGTAFAEIDVEIDRATGDISRKSARIVTTWADAGAGKAPAAEAVALLTAAEAKVAPLVSRVVGTASAAISLAQSASGESPLGDLIADAHRAAVKGADFALTNPGGIRGSLDAGPVTWGQLFTVQPFGNPLVVMTLSGAQMAQLLEQQFGGNKRTPRILQVSGLRYTWDASKPAGRRISQLRRTDGSPIAATANYRVVANAYLAEGGDGFTVFKKGTDLTGGPLDLEALVAYVQGLPKPFGPPAGDRITRE